MEIKPLITVITASYNSKYLYESISSVLSQTYEKIEYIVADDGTEGFDKEDMEMLSDMIMIAVNDAMKQVDREVEDKMGKYTQGMPGLF